MNDMYPPQYGNRNQEGGSGFRAFFFVILLMITFLFIASYGMRGIDLTPGTQASVQSAAPAQVVQGQSIVAPLPVQPTAIPAAQQPVVVPVSGSGACASPYTVQAGDTFSIIAIRCGVTLAQMQAANPHIANINLIFPGQQLYLYAAAAPVPTASPPQSEPAMPLPVTGNVTTVRSGSVMQVTGRNFPANIPITIGIGPLNQGYTIVGSATTDATGTMVFSFNLPVEANPGTQWVVVLTSSTLPVIQGVSDPFYLQ